MCQQGQAEITYYRRSEAQEIRAKYKQYEAGKIQLTDDELQEMAIRLLMLREE